MTIAITAGGSPVDFAAQRLFLDRLTISYSQPAKLTWQMQQPQHTIPIAMHAAIVLTDDATTLFKGFVEDIDPSEDSNVIIYTTYDPTKRAGREIPVMSTAWVDATTQGIGAVPRLIFNCFADNDPDYIWERDRNVSVGSIISTILTDAAAPLDALGAAAFSSSDLSALDYIPQEKVVFDSESIREAIDSVLQWEPSIKLAYTDDQWRFLDHTSATPITLTLNDHTADHVVLSMQLDRSLDDRWTAVKLYGPETAVPDIITVSSGDLTPDINTKVTLETVGAGAPIEAYSTFQITDPTRRRMAKLLPTEIYVNVGEENWVPSRSPSLQATWDGGTTWTAIPAVFDFKEGIVHTGAENYIYRYDEEGIVTLLGTQKYFPPDDVRLVYAYYDDPISVRSPASGYSGTAFSVFGIEKEYPEYHESLAVGYEYGVPYTDVARLAEFQKLADRMLAERSGVVYIGGVTLDGLDYRWLGLNKRVNIAGVDGDGNAITTGWENAGAYVTDVEYDFQNSTTTLQFSSDFMELFGIDVDQLKKELQIDGVANRETGQQYAITNDGILFRSNFLTPEQKAERAEAQAEAQAEHEKNMFGEIFVPRVGGS